MNITELNNTGPNLHTFVKICVPVTVGLTILIWIGKYIWTWCMGRKKFGGYMDQRTYFNVDRRENPTFYGSWVVSPQQTESLDKLP